QPLSEILAAVKRLSPATTAITIANGCGEICAAGAPGADGLQSEKLQSGDPPHSLGPTQPKAPTQIERSSLIWSAVGLSLVPLIACAIAAAGISRISVPVETWGAETVASDNESQASPGSSALATTARVDVSTTSATAALTPTAATSDFEE